MPSYRNPVSGAVVAVPAAVGSRLPGFVPVGSAPAAPAPKRPRRKKAE